MRGGVERIVAALVVFAGTFVFRFLTVDFTNDHFTHLTRARQIVLGDLPIRDFFDPGQLLQYYVSAAAQVVFGFNLFGEAVVTIGFMALAAALTFAVSRDLSGSRVIAACATTLAVAALPRLYNYPKAFLYVLAIWGFLRYARRPRLWALSGLALLVATAFLLRHDHGLYIWVAATVFLTIFHWRDRRQVLRATVTCGVMTCLLLLPFAVYVQQAGDLTGYLRTAQRSGRMVARSLDATGPLVTDEQAIADESSGLGLHRRVFTGDHALAWFHYGTVMLPYLAIAVLVRRRWTGRSRDPAETAVIGALAVLNLIVNQTLIRGSPLTRLADVAAPAMVLGAWLAGQWLVRRAGTGAPGGRLRLKPVAAIGFFAITLWSVSTVGGAGRQIRQLHLKSGPAAAWAQLVRVNRWLHLRPIDAWAPEPATGIRALARYVLECTQPTDRLFVTWFAPEIAFYAERGFAGGQVHLLPGWHQSASDQQLTVSRLRRQQVPIVLADAGGDAVFRRRFSIVHDYVYQHYVVAADSDFGGSRIIRVLVERGRTPARVYQPLALPCYR